MVPLEIPALQDNPQCYGYGSQSPRKNLSDSKASRTSGFQRLIKPTPDYVMIPICYRNDRVVPRQGNLNGFLRNLDGFLSWGIKHTGSLMPITSF